MNQDDTPFAGLEPHVVLAAVESLGWDCDGRLLALNSYENRVYQVGRHDVAPVIVKFYRPARWSDEAIIEEHDFSKELSDLEIPVVAPWRSDDGQSLHRYHDFRLAVYEQRSGSWPELFDASTRRWMGRLLGRIHAVGALRPFTFRPVLDAVSFGDEPREFLLASDLLAPGLRSRYEAVSAALLAAVREAFAAVAPLQLIRVHGDCHGGNILWGTDGPVFVDLDDSRMAPAVQDLWMFLEGTPDERRGQLLDILEGYEDFRSFDYRELRLVEAFRGLRLVHYSAWLARRWHDPAFPQAFPWFGTERYWDEHISNLDEQCQALGRPDELNGTFH